MPQPHHAPAGGMVAPIQGPTPVVIGVSGTQTVSGSGADDVFWYEIDPASTASLTLMGGGGHDHLILDFQAVPALSGVDLQDGAAGMVSVQAATLDWDIAFSGFETVTLIGGAGGLTMRLAPNGIVWTLTGGSGDDRLTGGAAGDTISALDGADTLEGGAGDDFLFCGNSAADLRDLVYGGDGNDSINGSWGNDDLNGGEGNDTVLGGFGADTVIGNAGNDVLGGGAGADLIFGNAGNDTLNGGFAVDRLNGGTGADSFFHVGIADHASDWIQDYNAAEGDVLTVGLAGATRAQFQVNITPTPGAGSAAVAEAFLIYRPTGQILWALVDGAAQEQINIQIGGLVFDLLA